MLKKLILENWKSFRYAELPIDPLTVLIGTNASGKSNAIEALEFLKRLALGNSFQESLVGSSGFSSIRGGLEWAVYKPHKRFTLRAIIQGQDDIDYLYSITIEIQSTPQLYEESLVKIKTTVNGNSEFKQITLFQTEVIPGDQACSRVNFYGTRNNLLVSSALENSYSTLSLYAPRLSLLGEDLILEDIKTVLRTLQNIFVFDPIPSKMRSFSVILDKLSSDGFNVAGVLASLPEAEKKNVELNFSHYIKQLPERDIQRVWAEPVGRLGSKAMLYCEEAWVPDEPPMIVDAEGMSDGTLRFIAILTALLTRPEGSQLVIEEVDAGLHPSRADLLLKVLREIGEKRKIDILVTTHNPALLNALGLRMAPFVVVAHRDAQTGESKLTPLDDLKHLPKLLASGSIGELATRGTIEKVLSQPD